MNNIKVEIASPEHINALEDFTREITESMGQKFDPKRFDWGIRRRLYDPLQCNGIFIAIEEDKNKPVGMIIVELRIDPFGLSEGYIKQFFLMEDYRRKGVREVLLQKALNHLKKIKVEKVKVNITEEALKASNLYGEMGFKKIYEVFELDLKKNFAND